jgi:hypothetical protein
MIGRADYQRIVSQIVSFQCVEHFAETLIHDLHAHLEVGHLAPRNRVIGHVGHGLTVAVVDILRFRGETGTKGLPISRVIPMRFAEANGDEKRPVVFLLEKPRRCLLCRHTNASFFLGASEYAFVTKFVQAHLRFSGNVLSSGQGGFAAVSVQKPDDVLAVVVETSTLTS